METPLNQPTALQHTVVVLHRPQDVVNIGGTLRAMLNMGVPYLRLVDPVAYTPQQISALAHRSEDILARTRTYPDLASAVRDAVLVVGTSARQHSDYPLRRDLRQVATELVATTRQGTVALVFGSEDNGLQRAELDQCHMLIQIPTTPTYASLNLAQAVLLLLYEVRQAATNDRPPPIPPPAAPAPAPANAAALAQLEVAWQAALHHLDFFETRNPAVLLRRLRLLLHRARPTARDVALLQAIAYAVLRERRPPRQNEKPAHER